MAIINERELIDLLGASKNVLLIEPLYTRKYVPLGLAKISSFVKKHKGKVTYSRNVIYGNFDLICITTCFTNDSQIVLNTIKQCKRSLFFSKVRIVVGGIFASLMPEYISEQTGVDVFVGCSDVLDSYLPDYSLNYGLSGFFGECDTLFTTRGCPNHCKYCMVWRMEKEHKIIDSWQDNIKNSPFDNIVVSDNNILSFGNKHLKNVVSCLNQNNKKVIFNNGVDCRLIDDENSLLLSSLQYVRYGFRTAFDRMSDDGYYQKAMEKIKKAGLKIQGNSYTYVLFNFNDTPQEAYYRIKECWKYKSVPYFMRYRPLDMLTKNNSYIGKYWTKNLVIAFSNYGHNFGYNRGDTTFESWIKNRDNADGKLKSKSVMTDEDWDKWYFKK